MKRFFGSAAIIMFFLHVPGMNAEPAFIPDNADQWISVLNAEIADVIAIAGDDYIELNPSEYSSTADRLVYYPEGLTLWSEGGKVIQLRFDSCWKYAVSGMSIGMSPARTESLLGQPWVTEENSFYYNLPWNNGPVRLRLVFKDERLDEAYLYLVR